MARSGLLLLLRLVGAGALIRPAMTRRPWLYSSRRCKAGLNSSAMAAAAEDEKTFRVNHSLRPIRLVLSRETDHSKNGTPVTVSRRGFMLRYVTQGGHHGTRRLAAEAWSGTI